MTFSEYALGLSPYISFGKSEHEYFTELIGNFIQDAVMDSCEILKKRKKDTKYRYIIGARKIQKKEAQYLYEHRDNKKFTKWIWDRMDDSDSYDNVVKWLQKHGVISEEPDQACFELLEQIFLDIINHTSVSDKKPKTDNALQLINDIEQKIKLLPRPVTIPVPETATSDEQIYIEELYTAYGDAEGIDDFSEGNLGDFPEYADDLEDRRIDYYAADAIRRGVLELGDGKLGNQFEILKSETLSGVKDTARCRHPNAYECMLAVMEQAAVLTVENYLLHSSPYWISAAVKKGVCHHLVNDRQLMWKRRRR